MQDSLYLPFQPVVADVPVAERATKPRKSVSVSVALPTSLSKAYRKLSKRIENARLGVVASAAYLDTDG